GCFAFTGTDGFAYSFFSCRLSIWWKITWDCFNLALKNIQAKAKLATPTRREREAYSHSFWCSAKNRAVRRVIALQNARNNMELGNKVYFKKRIQPVRVGSICPLISGRKLSALLIVKDKRKWFFSTLPLNW